MWLKFHFRWLQAMLKGQWLFNKRLLNTYYLPGCSRFGIQWLMRWTRLSSMELTCRIDSLTGVQVGFACEITEQGNGQ